MNILIVNGPNLNFLGLREPAIYGTKNYNDLIEYLKQYEQKHHHYFEIYQSNHEGTIIDIIQEKYLHFDGIILNPGAFTHYSYAIYDCIKSIPTPTIEVHLSDIHAREDFRKISVIQPACIGQISGKGFDSYIEAVYLLEKGNIEK